MRAHAPYAALLAGTALVPFVALWPILQPAGSAYAPAFDVWAARILWATILGSLASVIALHDGWLGVATGFGVLDGFIRPLHLVGQSTFGIFAFGALGLVWVRAWPPAAKLLAMRMLGAVALLEAVVMAAQWFGLNPLWSGWVRIPGGVAMTGTLGNTVFASTLVALTGPFAPWPTLPLLGLVLLGAHSKVACLAFALAVAVRFLPWRWALVAAAAALAVLSAGLWWTISGQARLWVWARAIESISWLGDGLGLAPAIATPPGIGAAYDPAEWRHVHNEPLQWARERGVVGVAIFAGWITAYAARLTGPRVALGACAGLVLLALVQAPFHVIATALPSVLILGLASPSSPTSDLQGA